MLFMPPEWDRVSAAFLKVNFPQCWQLKYDAGLSNIWVNRGPKILFVERDLEILIDGRGLRISFVLGIILMSFSVAVGLVFGMALPSHQIWAL